MKAATPGRGAVTKAKPIRPTSGGDTPVSSGNKGRPSDRLNPRTVDHFQKSVKATSATSFSAAYNRQDIPCRLVHGSVKHRIEWLVDPGTLDFNPLLVYFADGLQEVVHPFSFLAPVGFASILDSRGAREKAEPLLATVTPLLRNAMRSATSDVFLRGVSATASLSNLVGEGLNPFMKILLQPLASHVGDKRHREAVLALLTTLSENGGREATLAIKSKVPTFCGSF